MCSVRARTTGLLTSSVWCQFCKKNPSMLGDGASVVSWGDGQSSWPKAKLTARAPLYDHRCRLECARTPCTHAQFSLGVREPSFLLLLLLLLLSSSSSSSSSVVLFLLRVRQRKGTMAFGDVMAWWLRWPRYHGCGSKDPMAANDKDAMALDWLHDCLCHGKFQITQHSINFPFLLQYI